MVANAKADVEAAKIKLEKIVEKGIQKKEILNLKQYIYKFLTSKSLQFKGRMDIAITKHKVTVTRGLSDKILHVTGEQENISEFLKEINVIISGNALDNKNEYLEIESNLATAILNVDRTLLHIINETLVNESWSKHGVIVKVPEAKYLLHLHSYV